MLKNSNWFLLMLSIILGLTELNELRFTYPSNHSQIIGGSCKAIKLYFDLFYFNSINSPFPVQISSQVWTLILVYLKSDLSNQLSHIFI